MLSAKALGLDVTKSSASGEVLVLCPFHPDKNPSAWYNQAKGLLYCSVCGRGWNEKQIAKARGIELSDLEEEDAPIPERYNLITHTEPIVLGEREYNDYFVTRGISQATFEHYDLHWISSPHEAAVLPIFNLNSDLVGAVYRYLHPHESGTRYRFFGETTSVWPMHLLRYVKPKEDVLIVTEGVFSAMRIYDFCMKTYGYSVPVFSLMGAKANSGIVDTLALFKRVWYLYDCDAAGRRAKDKMCGLDLNAIVHCCKPSPDDMSDTQLSKLIEHIDYLESK